MTLLDVSPRKHIDNGSRHRHSIYKRLYTYMYMNGYMCDRFFASYIHILCVAGRNEYLISDLWIKRSFICLHAVRRGTFISASKLKSGIFNKFYKMTFYVCAGIYTMWRWNQFGNENWEITFDICILWRWRGSDSDIYIV